MSAAEQRSGKGHRDENFPVASRLIAARHRPVILAFYSFVRTADDVADHPRLLAEEKLGHLDSLEASLIGTSDAEPEGVALRKALEVRGLGNCHARDLLTAFRRDVTQNRYRDWNELLDYCRYSAMPVGRFVLDAHGESRETWPASDAICAALQIVNHLQDCGEDFRRLDRVYLPLDDLARAGASVDDLAKPELSPGLRACITTLAERAATLLDEGKHLAGTIEDGRLALEISVIVNLARSQIAALMRRNPLRGNARLGVAETATVTALSVVRGAAHRLVPQHAPSPAQQRASGSSFYAAMRILPRAKRDGMLEIYGFCRAVDDIADDGGERAPRHAALDEWRAKIERIYAGETPADLAGLAHTARRFHLAKEDFLAVIDGMEMDVREDIRAPDYATLDLYCDRVASAVGRLSVRVFGVDGSDGVMLAHHLGRALQLTNILRDIDEDAAIGRLYLPREALDAAGISGSDIGAIIAHPQISDACNYVVARARAHYREAGAVMNRASRSAVRAPRIMGQVYASVLDALVQRGWATPRDKVKVPRARLAAILLRHAVL